MFKRDSKIYIAGHAGLLGSAIFRKLKKEGCCNIFTIGRKELDLTRQVEVEAFFKKARPDFVILCAARVGGIYANSNYPAQFIYENMAIESNVIHAAYLYKVKKLLFFGSACSYPVECRQPMKESYFLTGPIEKTNISYAVAKIAGATLCQAYRKQYGSNFICAIPTNAYGPHDNFDLKDAHVIPALIHKFHNAKINGKNKVVLWGSGKPRREFIYSEDLGRASIFLMENYNSSELINIGTGQEISVKNLAYMIKDIIGYTGEIVFDKSKPDGASRKLLDSSKLKKMGWKAEIPLEVGIAKTCSWYFENIA